jgi:hypothetical protein
MNGHQENRSQLAAKGRRATMADQIVFGHLLPQYHAAQEWQDTVRALRTLESQLPNHPLSTVGILRALRDAIRRWRRQGCGTTHSGCGVGAHPGSVLVRS